jgi:hypothetical protein
MEATDEDESALGEPAEQDKLPEPDEVLAQISQVPDPEFIMYPRRLSRTAS